MLVLGTIFLYIAFSQRQRFGSQYFICHLNCTLFVTCDIFLCVACFSLSYVFFMCCFFSYVLPVLLFHICVLFYVLPVFPFHTCVLFYVLPPFQGNAQLWQHFSYHSASTWADIWTKKAIHCFSNIKS